MAGRNDATIVAALEAMAQAMENQPNTDGNVRSRSLANFQRENLPTFKGKYDPDGALGCFVPQNLPSHISQNIARKISKLLKFAQELDSQAIS